MSRRQLKQERRWRRKFNRQKRALLKSARTIAEMRNVWEQVMSASKEAG